MSKIKITTSVENLCQHPYHQAIYKTRPVSYLQASFERFGGKPLYDIIVVPNKEGGDKYLIVSGMNRFDTLLEMGSTEVEVIVMDISDELSIKKLIVDLNKQRVKDGEELLNEFNHYREMMKQQKGKGCNYSKVAKEIGWTFDKVKTYVMLCNFYKGDGEILLKKLFANELNVFQLQKLEKIIKKYIEKFNSEKSFDRITNEAFFTKKLDFNKLEHAVEHLSIDDDAEYDLMKSYLTNEIDSNKFNHLLDAMGKLKKKVKDHNDFKTFIPVVTDKYTTQNTHIINGNNQTVEFTNPFKKKIKCIITSPYYGNKRTYGDGIDEEKGHNMDGLEAAKDISKSLALYIPYLENDGSVYVIIDDFKLPNGELACSIEFLVTEMIKCGFHLVSRYGWIKNNAIPQKHNGKRMVNSIEWVYRFVLDPVNYYTNPNMFQEIILEDDKEFVLKKGCTNHSNTGITTRGGHYIQGHLKGMRNILDEQNCINAIKGNVANPEDYFRQSDEKKHTATAPIYLTSTLILEGTKDGDLVCDIYNGVGNTMTSALLLNRQYIGIELEKNYYQQTCRRSKFMEEMFDEYKSTLNQTVAA